jgi:small GTP-binding protein
MATVSLKLVVLGDTHVGKTALVSRASTGSFTATERPTVGAQSVDLPFRRADGEVVNLKIWDTAGQEKYRTLVPMYFRGAGAAVVVFDLTERSSFESLEEWVKQLRQSSKDSELAIVGNKADLDGRVVSWEEGQAGATALGANFYLETSAVTGQNVMEIFRQFVESPGLAGMLSLASHVGDDPAGGPAPVVAVDKAPEPQTGRSGGCGCRLV